MGYDFDSLRDRTWPELNALQLGWIVRKELENSGPVATGFGGSYSDRRKASHRRDIDRRLRQMEVERN